MYLVTPSWRWYRSPHMKDDNKGPIWLKILFRFCFRFSYFSSFHFSLLWWQQFIAWFIRWLSNFVSRSGSEEAREIISGNFRLTLQLHVTFYDKIFFILNITEKCAIQNVFVLRLNMNYVTSTDPLAKGSLNSNWH